MNAPYLLAVGFPSTGKSTLIAALWSLLQDQGTLGPFSQASLAGNVAYASGLADKWLQFQVLDHTPAGMMHVVDFNMTHTSRGAVTLKFLDCSGETYSHVLLERVVPDDILEHVAKCTGLFIMVHPDMIRAPDTLADVEQDHQAMQLPAPTGPRAEPPWDPEKTPTDVQLVDLLQCLAPLIKAEKPLRMVLAISGWDLFANAGQQTPDRWMSLRLPLLKQYLRSNPDIFQSSIFGLSAQGGDYKVAATLQNLQRAAVPAERCRAYTAAGDVLPLHAPLEFLVL